MTSREEMIRFVSSRAEGRCEYCRMHHSLQGATFHVEHIVPRSRGGTSASDNYAWCCPSCNLHKSDRTLAPDPADGQATPLFNPRRDNWSNHFTWDGEYVVGVTAMGRATVAALMLNHPRRILIRRAERIFGLFPPMASN